MPSADGSVVANAAASEADSDAESAKRPSLFRCLYASTVSLLDAYSASVNSNLSTWETSVNWPVRERPGGLVSDTCRDLLQSDETKYTVEK